jgi:hypothetical protein
MLFGVPGLKRTFVVISGLIVVSSIFISCGGGSSSPQTGPKPSKLPLRAFVSNPLEGNGAGGFAPVFNIVDASLDQITNFTVSLSGTSAQPGLMAVSPSKKLTMVFSPTGNTIAVVDNTIEGIAQSNGAAVPTITLPGVTESMLIAPDNATGYAAVPTAPVSGPPPTPGAVAVVSLTSGSVVATVPVPAVRTIVQSHNGNRILAFSDNSNSVTVITPANLHTSVDPRTSVCCFDHPVWAAFNADDSLAYVFDCGPECGGAAAGITVLDMSGNAPVTTIPLPGSGATTGLLNGNALYVAGSPPGLACGSGTVAPTCGTLNMIDVGSLTVTNPAPIIITDGYHNRIELADNQRQLFIGAKNCSTISSATEVRGCLTITSVDGSTVIVPPDAGDVTGIQPIDNRARVYVCQGGNFRIYDTTTDKLYIPKAGLPPIVIVGQATDVKLVD